MHSSTHTLSQDRKANGYDQEEAWFHEHNRRLLEGLKAKQKKEAAEVKQPASGQPASF